MHTQVDAARQTYREVAPISLTQAWITVHLDRHTAQTKPAGETLNLKLVLGSGGIGPSMTHTDYSTIYGLIYGAVTVMTARDRILKRC